MRRESTMKPQEGKEITMKWEEERTTTKTLKDVNEYKCLILINVMIHLQ